MPNEFTSKNVIVTGGTSGIGWAIANAFLKRGATVLATYRADRCRALAKQQEVVDLNGKLFLFKADFAMEGQVDALFERATSYFDQIHVLVNNAGVGKRCSIQEIEQSQLKEIFSVNVFAPFLLSNLVSKHMIEQGVEGSILNVSSLSATRARSGMADYQASKGALNSLTMSFAAELGVHRIRVNAVSPGLIKTPANECQRRDSPELWKQRTMGIPLGRPGAPEDLVAAVLMLSSESASWITGANLTVDGGMATL